uniref:BED-type domain-containing protein n=1 Tax=Cyprinus carpio carpio TaxID=630221 RepID=A0A9J8C1H8_CYPCA
MEGNVAFNHWMYRHHFIFKERHGKNVTVQCNLCLPRINLLSTASDSTSNLKKHLQEQALPEMCKLKDLLSQNKLNWSIQIYVCITQSKMNSLIFKFVVEDVQSFSVLEQPAFRKVIETLSGGKRVMSRKTFVARFEAAYDRMKDDLKAKLDTVQSVCTTADLWSSHNRSYFGMTCHWLEDNLERRSVALACTQIRGRHTYETVAVKIQEIHASYNIEYKVRATGTDNGSNFVKAFKEFSSGKDCEVVESHFEDLGSILCEEEMGGELSYFLPPHQRCAAHTLNLIASKDLVEAISKVPVGRLHNSAVAKCAALWNKAHHSTVAADAVLSIANMKLLVPCVTRWNSEYSAVQKVVSLTDSQLTYLKEYVDVLKPVATALDILQGEQKCYLGIVIPTLLTLKRKLQEKISNTQFFSEIIDTTVKAVDSRFKQLFDSVDAKLATMTVPQFRLWWLPESEREHLRAKLIDEVSQLYHHTATSDNTGETANEEEFFSYGPQRSGRDGQQEAVEEVQKYLDGTNKELTCLNEFPGVKKIFIKFNTTLLSSAPVERLFSHGGNILTAKRSSLSDEHFEQVLLLRYNSNICTSAFKKSMNYT